MERKKILIKHICFILALLSFINSNNSNGQDTIKKKYEPSFHEIDTTLLLNKAKLLTLSRFGVDDIDTIINKVLTQESRLIHTPSKFYDVIVIKGDLMYTSNVKTTTGMSTRFCGENAKNNAPCYYVLVYSYHTDRFYMLSGFYASEYIALDKDMAKFNTSIIDVFTEDFVKDLPFDFNCLLLKYSNSETKSSKIKCYRECGTCIEPIELN